MKVAVVGAGWAGCAAAVEATRRGHRITLFEAARTLGGRARRVDAVFKGQPLQLDNGQHILIGAYTETLRLMSDLGVDQCSTLVRMPLTLQFPDGNGLRLASLPAPLDAFAGIVGARGWSWADKLSLLKLATGWQLRRFTCSATQSVSDLCANVSPTIMAGLIEPLCVSALNTPATRASGQVFLRVMHDALFSISGGSNLLLPRTDLSALLPDAAAAWLARNDGELRLGARVTSLSRTAGEGWIVRSDASRLEEPYDAVLLACQPHNAARLVTESGLDCNAWLTQANSLEHEAIATVYVYADGARLELPMLSLHADARFPAQFVFDRAQLGGPDGLLAFVVSASSGDSADLTAQVLQQAEAQLGLKNPHAIKTVVEKRATFACTPSLRRPGMQVAHGLLACGDYVDGPYPATLEGAVRSGLAAARLLD